MENADIDKKELIEWIQQLDDQEPLRFIKNIKDHWQVPQWENLPDAAKVAIERGLEDVREGRVHSHEEVRKIYEKWL